MDPRIPIAFVLLAICLGFLVYRRLFGRLRVTLYNPMKVSVKQDGTIFVDGERVLFERLLTLLGQLETDGRLLLYHREKPQDRASPEAQRIINVILNLAPGVVCVVDESFTVQAAIPIVVSKHPRRIDFKR